MLRGIGKSKNDIGDAIHSLETLAGKDSVRRLTRRGFSWSSLAAHHAISRQQSFVAQAAYNVVLEAAAEADPACIDEAVDLLSKASTFGITPNIDSYNSVIAACGRTVS